MKSLQGALIALVMSLTCVLPVLAQTAPELVFTAKTTTGVESVTPELTWSTTPAATSCTASGASNWTGAKPASGSVALAAITTSQTYTLACTWPGDTAATIRWTAPTLNTDGTALTNLAGFRVKWGTSPTLATSSTRDITNPATLTTGFTGLAQGSWYFGVLAYNSAGVESALSEIKSKTIVASASTTRTVGLVVNPRPNPPLSLTVE